MKDEHSQKPQKTQPGSADYQLVLKYLHKLLRYKYRVTIIAILGAGIVFGLSWLLEERFSAQATVAINISEAPGGIKPKEYRGGNAIGVIEYDFIIDGTQSNERERHLARMESFGFISSFISKHEILPWLYAKDWDEKSQSWRTGIEPDIREAVKEFKSKALYVGTDKKTDLLIIKITANTPHRAAYLTNEFVDAFNLYIRSLDAEELKSRRAYLEQRLTEVRNTEMHRSIYRLLEAQLAVESLIFARENYPLEVIQPATEPLLKSYPPRKKWTALTLIGLLLLGYGTVIIGGIVTTLRRDLKAYNDEVKTKTDHTTPTTNREEWIDK